MGSRFFFFFYKLFIVGSIYGVIRLGIDRLHSWLTTRKVEYKEIRPILDGICIKTSTDALIAQIYRLKGRGITGVNSDYIHSQSVDWLREAIDEKVHADALVAAAKLRSPK